MENMKNLENQKLNEEELEKVVGCGDDAPTIAGAGSNSGLGQIWANVPKPE